MCLQSVVNRGKREINGKQKKSRLWVEVSIQKASQSLLAV